MGGVWCGGGVVGWTQRLTKGYFERKSGNGEGGLTKGILKVGGWGGGGGEQKLF